MAHTRNEENFDNYDPTPYQGGYNQAEEYGSIKPADELTAYAPAEFGNVAQGDYGHQDSSPYGAGCGPLAHPAYQRTEAHDQSAQPDYQGGAPRGGRGPRHDEESYGGEAQDFDSRREQQQHRGHRNPIPGSEEGSEYRGEYGQKERPSYSRPPYEQQDQLPGRSYGDQRTQEWEGEQNEGYRPGYGRPHHKHHGEEDEEQQQEGYRRGRREGDYTSASAEDAPQRPSYW